jgi:hypothetical protein
MIKLLIALVLVVAFLVGGLVAVWRNRNVPMGSPEVLERARQRNRQLEEEERREKER